MKSRRYAFIRIIRIMIPAMLFIPMGCENPTQNKPGDSTVTTTTTTTIP